MRHAVREFTLWCGAVCCLLIIVGTVASLAFGVNVLVFRSGSMSPEIPTGSLALTHRAEARDLAVGDVVSVRTTDGDRVTHRVAEVTLRHGTASLVLRGDANAVPDTEVYVVRSADRVILSVPWLGYAVLSVATGPGSVLVGGLVGALAAVLLSPRTREGAAPSEAAGPAYPSWPYSW